MSHGGQIAAIKAENHTPESELEVLDGSDEGALDFGDQRQTGVVIKKNDRHLSEFHRWYREGRLILDPEWQRNYVWANQRASRLVESFLIDIPVPVVYLAENKHGNYEVIDGLQRLTSSFRFFEGEYALSGLEILKDLNGKYFKDLDVRFQNKLWNVTLRAVELAPSTPKDLMFTIFERLNTWGTALNEMEIRNCLYRGSLNRSIGQLSSLPEFIQCISQKNISRRMDDRCLVLRFLAFYERTYLKATRGLKRFLNEFLEVYREAKDEKLKEFEQAFRKSMRASLTVFGKNGFRLRQQDKRGQVEWAPRPNAAIFQVIAVSFTQYEPSQITRAADAVLEEYLDVLATDPSWVDSVTKSTGDADRIGYAFQTWFERLDKVLSGFNTNDRKRSFSHELKEGMFQQSSTCAICGQNIKLLNDAAMDHDLHYWRAGHDQR